MRSARGEAFVAAAEQGRGALGVVLATTVLADAVAELRGRGIDVTPLPHAGRSDSPAGAAPVDSATGTPMVQLRLPADAPFDVYLVQEGGSGIPSAARAQQPGAGGFALKRLDHLAAMTRDLDAATRVWVEQIGVPLHGEVTTPSIVIRQFKIGDAIIELIRPASPQSPAAQRPAALSAMAACEVTDMAAAVARARAAGFTLPDAAPGALPGTRVTTIPAAELSGLALQLLEYV